MTEKIQHDLLVNPDRKQDETCDLCGQKLTLYGSKDIADGKICRTCAKISSRWLTDDELTHKTIEDMKKHLEYRKNNLARFRNGEFNSNKEIEGSRYRLFVDSKNKQFLFAKRNDFERENPDIIPFENIDEITILESDYLTGEDGVNIFFNIKLNGAEFKNIRIRCNDFPGIKVNSDEYKKCTTLAFDYLNGLIDEEDIVVEDVLEEKEEKHGL